jgi:MraZ protein
VRLFLSTYVNKVDRKGRVSVPAPFRTVLAGQNSTSIVVFRSFKHAALDCSGTGRLDEMTARLETLDQFSEEYDSLATLFADMQQLPFDGEGRVMLPDYMMEFAGITDSAAFVGLSKTFQIWEPSAFEAHQQLMRQRAREAGMTLPAARAGLLTPGTPTPGGAE